MTGEIVAVSQTELSQRRQKLRQQRRVRGFQAVWRFLAISGLTAGLMWGVTSPMWLIWRSEQVKIEGNQLIQTQTVRSLLPIQYPQSLFRLEPRTIASHLKTRLPLREVRVDRRLFPPSLTVQVKEQLPIAVALPTPVESSRVLETSGAGLVDETGNWLTMSSFTAVEKSLKLPALRTIGNWQQYRSYWSQFFAAVSRSPVKVSEVDWRNLNNVILRTEIGTVHLGTFSPARLAQQLETIDRMRQVPTNAELKQIEYIDLKSPTAPIVQIGKSKVPEKAGG